jgi:hypothetical protein
VAPGVHLLTVRATDNDGATATSSLVVSIVNSNTPPLVELVSPPDAASFTAPADIRFEATAADDTGTIRQVEFFANGVWLGSVLSSPFTLVWSNAPPGVFTLTARATDEFGTAATSAPVTVTVGAGASAVLAGPTVLGNGQFACRIVGRPDQPLLIQASTNLNQWTTIATNTSASRLRDFTDTTATAFRHRFYRTIGQP